jgi:hypothetical protein
VLNDNCLLLEFSEDSDIEFAKETIEKFFEDVSQKEFELNVLPVKKIHQQKDCLEITLEDNNTKRIKL